MKIVEWEWSGFGIGLEIELELDLINMYASCPNITGWHQ
jgi:hypothetical protein